MDTSNTRRTASALTLISLPIEGKVRPWCKKTAFTKVQLLKGDIEKILGTKFGRNIFMLNIRVIKSYVHLITNILLYTKVHEVSFHYIANKFHSFPNFYFYESYIFLDSRKAFAMYIYQNAILFAVKNIILTNSEQYVNSIPNALRQIPICGCT